MLFQWSGSHLHTGYLTKHLASQPLSHTPTIKEGFKICILTSLVRVFLKINWRFLSCKLIFLLPPICISESSLLDCLSVCMFMYGFTSGPINIPWDLFDQNEFIMYKYTETYNEFSALWDHLWLVHVLTAFTLTEGVCVFKAVSPGQPHTFIIPLLDKPRVDYCKLQWGGWGNYVNW